MTFHEVPAKRLAVGDLFVRHSAREEAERDGWAWRLLRHDFTVRGDYSSMVECDGSDWTERFEPDELVWLAAP